MVTGGARIGGGEMPMMISLGNKVKQERKLLGLTLQALGDLCGMSKSSVWEIENDRVPRPSAESVFSLSRALGVSMEYLMSNDLIEPSSAADIAAENARKLAQIWEVFHGT